MKLNVNPIYKLIAQGEHQQQDFKYCINDSRKIARSLVAFANTDGGRLLIGVKDNGKIIGISSDEEYYMVEAAAKIYSSPKIEFTTQQWDVDGKVVLEIMVGASPLRPHFAHDEQGNRIAYIRNNDENILANGVLLKSWKLEKKPSGIFFRYDEPRKTLIEFLSNNENITLSKFSKIAQINRLQAETILAELLTIKCIEARFGEKPVTYYLNQNFVLKEMQHAPHFFT
jgi:predicted HTH transcriptional regulator